MTLEAIPFEDAAAGAGQRVLRTGHAPWQLPAPPRAAVPQEDMAVDVLVIGAGVTGAMAAERITRSGRRVAIVDAMLPAGGSTAASTAMLLWELDTRLVDLAAIYGFERAVSIYRRSLAAVRELGDTIGALGLDCGYHGRPALYLAGGEVGEAELAAEHEARRRADLPGHLLGRAGLADHFAIDRPAAIVSPDAAEADPVRLARGFLDAAVARGAVLLRDEAVAHGWGGRRAHVALASGHAIEAGAVVLATGYRMPSFVPTGNHRIVSTWCAATSPDPDAALWPQRALIWEAGEPYLYARTTGSGRIIIGGEDEATPDADERERRMPAKVATLERKLFELWPAAGREISHAWSAEFGETSDGLPLIGPVPGASGFFAAYGYGGNGITYSFLAAGMLAAQIRGEHRDWFDDFALDRDAP